MTEIASGAIIGVDSFGDNSLVIVTENGEISLSSDEAPVVHTKNDATIRSVISPTRDITLVFTEKRNGKISAAAYQSPDLQQISELTLHDAHGAAIINVGSQIVAVYTQAAVRIIEFDIYNNPKAKILRTIDLKGVTAISKTAVKSRLLLVATESEYQLVNVLTGAITPLFPILKHLEPRIARVDNEFLVVQGTQPDEPAMGLFVDITGEVGRHGVIVEWPTYPQGLASSGDYLFSVTEQGLLVHSLHPSSIEKVDNPPGVSIPPSKIKRVFELSYAIKYRSDEVYSRLGDETLCLAESQIAFLSDDNKVDVWKSAPWLVTMEQKICRGEIEFLEPDPKGVQGEQRFMEMAYLSMCLLLHLLLAGDFSSALKEWRRGVQLDTDLLLYVYGRKNESPKIFPGLNDMLDKVRQKGRNGELDERFLVSSLRSSLKKLRRSGGANRALLKELELTCADILLNTYTSIDELMRFLLDKDLVDREASIQKVYSSGRYDILEEYYSISGRFEDLTKMRLHIIRDPASAKSLVREEAERLVDTALSGAFNTNASLDLWDLALEIFRNEAIDYELGLKLITSSAFINNYSPSDMLHALREETSSGEPWKAYLKYLVYEKGMFQNDLVDLLVSDVITLCQQNDNQKQIESSYRSFAALKWPKPRYDNWLPHAVNHEHLAYPKGLLKLQLELWGLMKENLDWIQLMSTFDSQLHVLKFERAVLYERLGLHEQSLELITSITDYKWLINYSSHEREFKETQEDLSYLSLKILLRSRKEFRTITDEHLFFDVLQDFLTAAATILDMKAVLRLLGDTTPFHVAANFLCKKVRNLDCEKGDAQLYYALMKANGITQAD